MKAVILAAGIGSRLRPITNEKPKCLTMIYGKSLLERQLSQMENIGVSDAYVVIGYRSEDVISKNIRAKYKNMRVHFVDNENYESTNNMYSLYMLKDFIKGEAFILCNGDVIFENKIIQKLVDDSGSDLIAVDKSAFLEESMKIVENSEGKIIDISKRINSSLSNGCSIDLYKFSERSSEILFNEIDDIIEVENNLKEWTEIALQRLFKSNKLNMQACDIGGFRWVEIDDNSDLAKADILFSEMDMSFDNALFFIDLDGTLFIGDKLIPGAKEFINELKKKNDQFYLLSNNSSYSKSMLKEKLKLMGIQVDEKEILLSTDGLISFLKSEGIQSTYVVGTKAMKLMLSEAGIETDSQNPEYVILGYDTELEYHKLVSACNYITKGIPYLATHCDLACPTPSGPIPDIGSIIMILEHVTGKSPFKIFGKPNAEMVMHIIEEKQIKTSSVYVIGDRLYTDMELSNQIGANFICVLSGETSRVSLEKKSIFPELIINSVADLILYI